MNAGNDKPLREARQIHRGKAQPFGKVIQDLTGLSADDAGLIVDIGGAYLGKRRCKDAQVLVRPGQQVGAFWRWPLQREEVAFDPAWVVHQDRDLLIANKPAGLPTQGRRDADTMAFYEILKKHVRGYLGLHHRLDQDTSGLMIFAKDRRANAAIAQSFEHRTIKKTYLAVCGTWELKDTHHEIKAGLAPVRHGKGTRQTVSRKGKAAHSKFRLLASEAGFSLVVAEPVTGRTHQIRAHLAHLGMPLLGDALYGSSQQSPFLLHCARLHWPARAPLTQGDFKIRPPASWDARLPQNLQKAMTDWIGASC